MASLLDIGPLTEEVEIRGTMVTVQGLTAGHLFKLFAEFPDMRKLFDSDEGGAMGMLDLAPDLFAKIIAIVTGSPNSKEVEAKAKTMGATEQLSILAAVQRLSFPKGIGPFIEQVNQMMGSSLSPIETVLHAQPGPPSSKSTIKSRALSNASLQMDTPDLMHGPARRAN